jgi:cation diffusion facilitator family transporter
LSQQSSNIEKVKAIQFVLVLGCVLTIIKFTAYFFTNSAAILTDALESIVNIVASLFAWFSIYISSKNKDTDHPYGHGKIEYISAGFEGGLILISGIWILYEAFDNLFHQHVIDQINWGILLMSTSGILVFVLGNYLIKKGNKLHSLTLIADGKHLLTDAYASIGILIGLLLIKFTELYWLDSIIAILYSCLILFTGYKLVRESLDGLMDKIDFETAKEIIDVINKNRHESWIDVHNMRLQKFGKFIHVDCHITLPWYNNLEKTHQQMEMMDNILNQHFDNRVEFFIHPDPCKPTACGICQLYDCKERKFEFKQKVVWQLDNVLENKAHQWFEN